VGREVGFYALAIALLWNALRDRRPADDGGSDVIYVHLSGAGLLFGAYILYVIVCGNYPAILKFCGHKEEEEKTVLSKEGYGTVTSAERVAIPVEEMPFLRTAAASKENFTIPTDQDDLHAKSGSTVDLYHSMKRPVEDEPIESSGDLISFKPEDVSSSRRSILGMIAGSLSVRLFAFAAENQRPSDQHDIHDLEQNKFEERVSCFLWQRSVFYSKAQVSLNGWHLRWFSFTHSEMASVPDRLNAHKHVLLYPKFKTLEIDEARMIIRLCNPIPGKRDFYLMASSREIFDVVVKKCEDLTNTWETSSADAMDEGNLGPKVEMLENGEDGDADSEPSLIEFPAGEPWYIIIMFLFTFPLRFLMQYTIPDVRHLSPSGDPKSSLMMALCVVVSCLVWLIIGSYAMVASLEALADLMDIPDAVIGVTVSAAGTSLPNYVASQIAARQGFGNMAVSNAFGSNTFNILVGLGFPWFIYILFVTGGEPYAGLRDDGITVSVLILAAFLLSFIVLMFINDFVLHGWTAPANLFLYAVYLTYAIGSVYW